MGLSDPVEACISAAILRACSGATRRCCAATAHGDDPSARLRGHAEQFGRLKTPEWERWQEEHRGPRRAREEALVGPGEREAAADRVAAVTELDQGDLQNPQFLRDLVGASAEVIVGVSEKKVLDLKLQGSTLDLKVQDSTLDLKVQGSNF